MKHRGFAVIEVLLVVVAMSLVVVGAKVYIEKNRSAKQQQMTQDIPASAERIENSSDLDKTEQNLGEVDLDGELNHDSQIDAELEGF